MFMLATSLRRAKVTGLTWKHMDLSHKLAWVHPDQAKARKAIAVPLNDTALGVLESRAGDHPVWAFTHKGEKILQTSTLLFLVQELAGWVTERTARRYAHLAADHLAPYMNRTEFHGTNLSELADGHS